MFFLSAEPDTTQALEAVLQNLSRTQAANPSERIPSDESSKTYYEVFPNSQCGLQNEHAINGEQNVKSRCQISASVKLQPSNGQSNGYLSADRDHQHVSSPGLSKSEVCSLTLFFTE